MNDKAAGAVRGGATGATIGTEILPGWGTAIGAVGGAALGYFLTPNRPKYTIDPAVAANQALGQQAAFGTNAAISKGQSQADQQEAQDVNTAQNYTSNTGQILNVLRSANSNRNATNQNLSIANSEAQSQGRSQLMGANNAAIDEKDKAWNYNVNQPYQNQVAGNRNFQQGNSQNWWKLLDSLNAKKTLNSGFGSNAKYNRSAGLDGGAASFSDAGSDISSVAKDASEVADAAEDFTDL